MFCDSCGARIPDGSTFCEECGARITSAGGGAGNSGSKIIPRASGPSAPPIPPSPPAPNVQGNVIPPESQVQSAPIPPAPNVNYRSQQAGAPAPSGEGAGLSGNMKNIIMAAAGVLAVVVIVVAGLYAKKNGLIGGKSDKTENIGTEVSTDVMPENAEQQVAETVATETTEEAMNEAAGDTAGETEADNTDQNAADETAAEQAGSGNDADYSQTSSGSLSPSITGPDQDVVLHDFDWYFNDGFPEDGMEYKELWGLGGMWKSMLYVNGDSGEKDIQRMVLSDADVQYMGYKLTVLFHTKARYEKNDSSGDDLDLVDNSTVTMTLEGDWDEERTSMDVYSVNSDLNCKINRFVTVNGFDYAIGPVLNGDIEIGKVVMIRAMP